MVRLGDVLHAGVFVACVAGGAATFHYLDLGAMRGMGYGLVTWVVVVLAYLAITHMSGRSGAQRDQPAQAPAVADNDGTAFEIEDGKND